MKTQTFNFVLGYVHGEAAYTVTNPEKTIRLAVAMDRGPITVDRCKEVLKKAKSLSGRNLYAIEINHHVYEQTPGNDGDHSERCLSSKRYRYNAEENSLVIFDRDEPIYANDNGIICRDQAALFDSLNG